MVASEIGTLADQSAVYVKEITEVVRSVKNAFENLADNSRDILEFVDGRVRKDYELLVDTGSNYEKDAVYVSGFSEDTAAMAEELNASTEEISGVIQTISANIEDTSLSFEEISKNMNETYENKRKLYIEPLQKCISLGEIEYDLNEAFKN